MKKSLLLFAISGFMAILPAGCNKDRSEEVKTFANDFAQKASDNEIEDLIQVYPDIESADSIYLDYDSSEISVKRSEDDKDIYEVTLSPDVTIKVQPDGKDSFKVTESKGMFAYPRTKAELARKTGLWEDDLTDKKLAKRMNDYEFFAYLDEEVKKKAKTILTVGDMKVVDYGLGYQEIHNNSDEPIAGSDYVINMAESFRGIDDFGYPDYARGTVDRFTIPGKPIPPHGSVKIEVDGGSYGGESVTGVTLRIPEDQLKAKFIKYTGNEYKEYLNSKK